MDFCLNYPASRKYSYSIESRWQQLVHLYWFQKAKWDWTWTGYH